MDSKAITILSHYRQLIEDNSFDEYDIWGFLIFIRNYVNKDQFPAVYEFCDLIAHRKRNRGIVMDCIKNAIDNHYETLPNSTRIKDYHGIKKERWINEWNKLGEIYKIRISSQTVSDIMLCIFSLAQNTEYSSKQYSGKVVIGQGKNGDLALFTTEGLWDSLFVCFSKYGPYEFKHKYVAGMINEIVETRRVGKELQLWSDNQRII